ncbi:hypothetical protein HY450_00415 [Candidatus Pacearchaeota archaeon]|nr:hypothetical protein [Candidatus Pacearchaeota archaeon]
MRKILGYIFSILGILGVAGTAIPEARTLFPLPPEISDTILLVISIALILVGIFIIMKTGKRRGSVELPIFQGKNVVGFRRTK